MLEILKYTWSLFSFFLFLAFDCCLGWGFKCLSCLRCFTWLAFWWGLVDLQSWLLCGFLRWLLFLLFLFLFIRFLWLFFIFIWVFILLFWHVESISVNQGLFKFLSDSFFSLQIPSVHEISASNSNDKASDDNGNDGTCSDSTIINSNDGQRNRNWSEIAVGLEIGILSSLDSILSDYCQVIVDGDLSDHVLSVMNDQQTDSSEGIRVVSGEGKVKVKTESSFSESHTTQHILSRNIGSIKELIFLLYPFSCCLVEDPPFSGVIHWQNFSTHLVKCLQACRQVVDNGEIPVKVPDEVWNFVVTVPVEDLSQCCFKDLSVLVNMEIESQSVEVPCSNDDF